jgi:hypothetical protein
MEDVWSGTIHKSSVDSVWCVDQVFPCRVYIDLNRRDSQILVLLVCGSHHIDNLADLMSLSIIHGCCLLYLICLQLLFE